MPIKKPSKSLEKKKNVPENDMALISANTPMPIVSYTNSVFLPILSENMPPIIPPAPTPIQYDASISEDMIADRWNKTAIASNAVDAPNSLKPSVKGPTAASTESFFWNLSVTLSSKNW